MTAGELGRYEIMPRGQMGRVILRHLNQSMLINWSDTGHSPAIIKTIS